MLIPLRAEKDVVTEAASRNGAESRMNSGETLSGVAAVPRFRGQRTRLVSYDLITK